MYLRAPYLSLTKRLFSTITGQNTQKNPQVRVRFAPSPTGKIHLGGLRTALYNFIFARQHNGKFILRLEDTDQSRIVPGSAEEIEDVLNWAGLSLDESPTIGGDFGPYLQSKRLELYKHLAHELIESKFAYRCFCSSERLELLRKYQTRNREKHQYDGKCRYLSDNEIEEKLHEKGHKYVIRFKLNPGITKFVDLIFGEISNNLLEAKESDPIILKTDGFPTYHFANVVDDHYMNISHVLRGSEWISSTSKHVQIYGAFNWDVPQFAHFPLITMRDGSKMSKRDNETHVTAWRDAGYRPLALINFMTNMGGGVPKSKQDTSEVWDLDTIVEKFNFQQVTCHPGSVDLNRLRIYSSKEIQKSWHENPDEIFDQLNNLLKSRGISHDIDESIVKRIIGRFIGRITTIHDLLLPNNAFIWHPPSLSWSVSEYHENGIDLRAIVSSVIETVKNINIEDRSCVNTHLNQLANQHNVSPPLLMKLIRKLLTNSESGLPVNELFECLGKERLSVYLNKGLEYVC